MFQKGRVGLGILSLVTLSAAQTQAQSGALRLTGTYQLVPEESEDFRAAIRAGTEGASFFVRNIGRGVLERALEPAQRVSISFDTTGVSIVENGTSLDTPLGGAATETRNARGEREVVSTTLAGDTLRRTFRASKATRLLQYTVAENGKLRVDVDVTGKVLPRSVRYYLVYRRLDGTEK
jgi:hypothetical protein